MRAPFRSSLQIISGSLFAGLILCAAGCGKQAEEKDGEMVTGRITQQEIADMVGASRAMVSRILKDLKEGGYISIEKKRITIHQKLPIRW